MSRQIVERMGLDSKAYRLYTLRHTTATHAIARKVRIKAVSKRLGHASVSRTLETYTHVLPAMQSEAVEVLGAIAYSKAEGETSEPDVDAPVLVETGRQGNEALPVF